MTYQVGGANVNTTFSGNITNQENNDSSGAVVSLVKVGTATQTLAGADGFTGGTTVNAGTLQVANALALQASTFNSSGAGTLGFASSLSAATLGGLQGSGNLTVPNSFALRRAPTMKPPSSAATCWAAPARRR